MAKQKYNWLKLKQEYMIANLVPNGKGLELKELAENHGIPIAVLGNRAHQEHWVKELGHAKKEKDAELSKQVQKAAVEIDKGKLMEEYKVRAENYKAATKVLEKLQKRWDSLTDDEFKKISVSELIKGMFACLKARGQAAGLPEVFKLNHGIDINVRPGEVSVEESTLRQARKAEMAKILLDQLEKKKDEGTIDV